MALKHSPVKLAIVGGGAAGMFAAAVAAELGRWLLSVPPKLVRALDDFSYDPRLLARWRDAMADVIERMRADRPVGQSAVFYDGDIVVGGGIITMPK